MTHLQALQHQIRAESDLFRVGTGANVDGLSGTGGVYRNLRSEA